MSQFFPHEKLKAYQHALKFIETGMELIDSWRPSFAVCNQFDRAMESIITNLAIAVRHQRTGKGAYHLECSLGSVLECAACLDVAQARELIDSSKTQDAKRALQEIAPMEIGLRNSWADSSRVRERDEAYTANEQPYFNHEKLDVYIYSLSLHRELGPLFARSEKKPVRYVRRIDELSTSLTLNIAEGNGRYSKRDHREFLNIAEDSATKLVAYLDLAGLAWSMDMKEAKALVSRVVAMLSGLKGYLESEG